MKLKNWQQTEQNGVNVWPSVSICMRDELRSKVRPTILSRKLQQQSLDKLLLLAVVVIGVLTYCSRCIGIVCTLSMPWIQLLQASYK